MNRIVLVAIAVLLASPLAVHAAEPKDCSQDPAPDGALVLRIDDQSHPLTVARTRSQQKMSIGSEEDDSLERFEVFAFSFRDAESIFPPHEVEVSVLVLEGEALDGKVFRRLPVSDMQKQPTPVKAEGTWLPEVQSIEVSSEPDGIDYEHGIVASARIEFGKRSGDIQPGKLRLCIAPGQTDDTFLPAPTRAIVVEGAFEAKEGL
jgi:hypothetical protein